MAHALVVDDDRLIRSFLEKALVFGGHTVTAASDGLEAIELIDSGAQFDVGLIDHVMPGASGIEVIAHARNVDPSIACIIVTAQRDLDVAVEGMHAGAVGYIAKPFKSEHLLTVVANALRQRDLGVEATRLRLLTPMLEHFAMVLANTLESKDVATHEHAARLATLASRVSERMGLDDEEQDAIRLGAALHDIGKVAVPEELLRKPGPLTKEELAVMRKHPETGAAILEDIQTWDTVRLIVRHHHERFDGKGYPDRLRGAKIPLGARIVGVVDSFDVMRTGRPYAKAKSPDQILEEFARERGRQFDPDVLDSFLVVMLEEMHQDHHEHLVGGGVVRGRAMRGLRSPLRTAGAYR
ncbi:MAG TPA: HD domain-containing phosphohydrolase [Candidatus Dormibacteraeota bacterium]|nr:HD domain-containing phosphohydrolase [Candidatus Dormibacteraeota bacterium]